MESSRLKGCPLEQRQSDTCRPKGSKSAFGHAAAPCCGQSRVTVAVLCAAAALAGAVRTGVAAESQPTSQAASSPSEGGIRKAELETLAKQIEDSFKNYVQSADKLAEVREAMIISGEAPAGESPAQQGEGSETEGTDVERKLRAVSYDVESLGTLRVVLATRRPPLADVYVANLLLRPLLLAKKEVIREGLPFVKTLCGRLVVYRQMPRYTRAQLESLRLPANLRPDEGERTRQAFSEVERRQKAKLAGERPYVLYGRQVRQLENSIYQLMVLADDRREDRQLLTAIVDKQRLGLAVYADIVEMIRAEASNMTAERPRASTRHLWASARAPCVTR